MQRCWKHSSSSSSRKKIYLQNCQPRTIAFFKHSFKTYKKIVGEGSGSTLPTKKTLDQFVIGMRQKGLGTGGCNAYIRGLNSFLDWLHQNEYVTERLRIKRLKQEKKVMRAFTDDELKKLIAFKPKTYGDKRLHTLVLALIDTGCRINELLSLRRSNINLESLVFKVTGKGRKERVVPISFDLRRMLARWLAHPQHRFDLVFPSSVGTKMDYRNIWRDFNNLCERLGIDAPEGFHGLRRTFARNYLRQGGNLIYLQSALGHARIETTRIYVEVETEDLKQTHLKTSILSRLK